MNALALFLSAAWIGLAGCSYYVMDSYPRYLENNPTDAGGWVVEGPASYDMTPATERHVRRIKSFMAGWANDWYIEFGKVLTATLESEDLRRIFPSLRRATDDPAALHLDFELKAYDFRDSRAFLSLAVRIHVDGRLAAHTVYRAEGEPQGEKVFFGGAFAMRNAIHQSTKSAMDLILGELVADVVAFLEEAPAPSPGATSQSAPSASK